MSDKGFSVLRRLPGTVIALGTVSLFTDMASEMIYPLMPVFLAVTLGAGAISLGIIEGVAESTAALLKIVSGIWSDRVKRRKPLILAGYSLAGVVRPLIGFATSWFLVLGVRFADRVGKGLRSSPRDALIADVTAPEMRGAAFGLHRSMDHAGAVLGPLVAAALLHLAGVSMRHVFFLAAIPGAIVIAIILGAVREKPAEEQKHEKLELRRGLEPLGGSFGRLLLAILVFTLGNSTDAFLLLRLSSVGVDAEWIALLWSAHHVVKMGATFVGGRASDIRGRRSMIIAGWLLYAAVYVGFALVDSEAGLIAIFLGYGLYFGFTEPVERAWVSDLAPEELRGTAYGWYHGAIGIAALPASLLFGLLWKVSGPGLAFGVGAGLALVAVALVLRVPRVARS